jgi:hypothetical protein
LSTFSTISLEKVEIVEIVVDGEEDEPVDEEEKVSWMKG